MDTNTLKKFAQSARRELLEQVAARMEQVLHTDSVALREKLDVVNELRDQLDQKGKERLIEEVAYTWFNRFCALRYMDVNHITKIGIVSPIQGFTQPEILQDAKQGIFDSSWRLDRALVRGLLNGALPSNNPEQEAYRLLLVAVCNNYAEEMDFLFPRIEDYTELLMPEDLLSSQSVLQSVRETLTPETCQDVEVIGWLYQFYISEKKDKVMAAKGAVAKEDIPAVTQLFTPHWIVRYMVENSLGRLWLLNHPESSIREQMDYYIDPALTPTTSSGESNDTLTSKSLTPTLSHWERASESPLPLGEDKGEGREQEERKHQAHLSQETIQRCRNLRKNATDAEQLLWGCLRDRLLSGFKFRRQHPVDKYILDFYCHEAKLCVEVDGGGHSEAKQEAQDANRTAFLQSQGIRVVRYWNHEVMEELEGVLEDILYQCLNPHTLIPTLSPVQGSKSLTPTLSHRERESESPLPEGEEIGERDFLKVNSPEELKILDPACGSGHILTYAFDLLYAIYEEQGYDPVSIPQLILEKNLYGIEIDKRAAMLASFALMMKAVQKDSRFFRRGAQPNILEMEDVSFTPQEIKAYMEKVGEDLWTQDLWQGLQQFENAKTFGSLIQPVIRDVHELRERMRASGVFDALLLSRTNENVQKVLEMSEYLSPRYHAVVANPPYFSKGMDADFKQFAQDHYPNFKSDTFSMFVKRNTDLALSGGQLGFMTPFVWMFISSYEKMRQFLIDKKTITSLVQLEYSGFEGATVPICTFTLENKYKPGFQGGYIRLSEFRGSENQAPKTREAITNPGCGWFYRASAADFKKIPGAPIAYWVSKQIREVFLKSSFLKEIADPRQGLATTDNKRFLRFWFEVERRNISFDCTSTEESINFHTKWFPYNKGGSYRKWAGNQEYVVNWENDGEEIKNTVVEKYPYLKGNFDYVVKNRDYYFRESITWSFVSSSYFGVRYSPPGAIFDVGGSSVFPKDKDIYWLTGFMCSKLSTIFMSAMNPTLNFQVGDVASLPVIEDINKAQVASIAQTLIHISKSDWDQYETSWDFSINPLLKGYPLPMSNTLEERLIAVREIWYQKTQEMSQLECRNNSIFIDAYGLQDELDPELPIDEITLTCNPHYRYRGNNTEKELESRHFEDTMKEFISYAIGCTFGRYSLNKPDLILANQGETVEDYYRALNSPTPPSPLPQPSPQPSPRGRGRSERESNDRGSSFRSLLPEGEGQDEGQPLQVTFPPTETNVIPIVEGEWFADDAVSRFKQFLRVTFGGKNYTENLKFIEDALGKDLEKYFLRDFYKDHVQMYKKRPIYWLFSSPNGSFNALIYMHRYQPDTVSVVLNQYLREYRDKLIAHRRHLDTMSENGNASARDKSRAIKESESIVKILAELKIYEDEILYPLAGERIEIDLDDGVVVNYAKFGEALKKI